MYDKLHNFKAVFYTAYFYKNINSNILLSYNVCACIYVFIYKCILCAQ